MRLPASRPILLTRSRPVSLAVQLVCGRYRPDRDGVAAYVERLADALPAAGAAAGVEVRAEVVEWPGLRHFRAGDADLVHVQFAPAAYGYRPGIGLLPHRTRRPVVTTLHEYAWWQWPRGVPGALWRPLERRRLWDRETLRLTPASREVICTSGGQAADLAARLGRAPQVVPIGANIEVGYDGGRAQARRELGLPGAAPVLVFFGFVHPVKGLRYLLEALPALRARHAGTRLLVAGGWRSLAWPDAEADAFVADLREEVRALGLTDAVTFLGYQEPQAVSRALVAADLAVLPFTAGVTAKSGSLLACWAHGLPVVGPRPVGLPDPEVDDAVAAVDRRDAASIAAVVGDLLDDAEARARLAAAGQGCLAGRSWPDIAARHVAIYQQALRPRGGG